MLYDLTITEEARCSLCRALERTVHGWPAGPGDVAEAPDLLGVLKKLRPRPELEPGKICEVDPTKTLHPPGTPGTIFDFGDRTETRLERLEEAVQTIQTELHLPGILE